MAKIKLTLEEKVQIIEAINKGLEPDPDLLPKIFPKTAEKFDVAVLERSKIPTLEYAGKRTKATILAEAIAGIGAAPLQTVRCFGDATENNWKNMIIQGDNLQFLKTCYKDLDPMIKGKVKGQLKLIYIDPPFATKSDFGGNEGEYSYADKVDRSHFLETLRERLIFLRELLADDGSIYVHLDQKMSHYVKIIMDEVFGKDRFVNEMIWSYKTGGVSDNFFARKHDAILFYTKNNKYEFHLLKEKTYIPTLANRTFAIEKLEAKIDEDGCPNCALKGQWYKMSNMRDVWEVTPLFRNSQERTNYPTQKPEELLRRVISASTSVNDLVLDCFAGSGTTLSVAEKLGRRWIGCDFGKLRIAESKKLGKDVKNNEKYNLPSKPFCVVSSGAYDFSHVMDLRKNKETYIDFVLGLFQLVRDEEKAAKFRLGNIYSLKDNNPVEVYPVWDDQYLKDVRIDEIYLQGIIDQAGGRLQGDYYLISPESCVNIGDTTLKNQEGKDVNFIIKTFPYKILEDISQKLTLSEQPSSAENINDLVTSNSFYFNEDVEIEVIRVHDGLKITKFGTKILDGSGNRFEGISGLAMLLVDLDYVPNKPFDMDIAVYAKEISEDGICKVAGLTPSLGIIAIDKHGNESKPFQIK
jgi:DNA modification methylase